MKTKRYHVEAWLIAEKVIERLRPFCERIEIAGSLRRLRPEVGDIEIVAVPKSYDLDLFGVATPNHSLDSVDWKEYGKFLLGGHKYKKIWLHEEIQLDLFIVTHPAQWGTVFLIRTGSADFSHRFVTPRAKGSLLPSYLREKDGAIWRNNRIIKTPEEKDVFDLAGVK